MKYPKFSRIYEVFTRILGGAVYSKAAELVIKASNFYDNAANKAGALMIMKSSLGNETQVMIVDSSFILNNAGLQASTIQFFSDLVKLYAMISKSNFFSNDARCKEKKILICFCFLFFPF